MARAVRDAPMGVTMAPTLEVDPAGGLRIEWPDGHQSTFPFAELRALCPCAACREQAEQSSTLRVLPSDPESALRIVRIGSVGRYAIQISWGDGHNSGIYSWDYLRAHCGCLACRLAREGEAR